MKIFKRVAVLAVLCAGSLSISCVGKEFAVTQPYYETEYRTENITEVYTENVTSVSSVSGEYELPGYYNWSSAEIIFAGFSNFYYYGYDIPESDSYDDVHLKISVWKQPQFETAAILIYDVTKSGHLSAPEPPSPGDTSQEEDTTKYKIYGSNASADWLHTANQWINHSKLLGSRTNLWSSQDNPQIIDVDAGKARKVAVIVSGPANQWNARITLKVAWTVNSIDVKPVTKERVVQKQTPYQVPKQNIVYQLKQVPFWENIRFP